MLVPCYSVLSVTPLSLCCQYQCQSLVTLLSVSVPCRSVLSVSALSLWHLVIHPCRFLLVGAPVQTAPTSTLHPSRDSLPLPSQCSCSQLVNAHALSWLEAVGLLPAMLTALPPCVAFHSSHDYSSRLLLYSVAIPIPSPIPYSGRGRGADKPRPHLDRSAFVWKPGNTNKSTHIRQVEQRMANQPRLVSVRHYRVHTLSIRVVGSCELYIIVMMMMRRNEFTLLRYIRRYVVCRDSFATMQSLCANFTSRKLQCLHI